MGPKGGDSVTGEKEDGAGGCLDRGSSTCVEQSWTQVLTDRVGCQAERG